MINIEVDRKANIKESMTREYILSGNGSRRRTRMDIFCRTTCREAKTTMAMVAKPNASFMSFATSELNYAYVINYS